MPDSPPDPPEYQLPRLGGNTPEEKAERDWESNFDGKGGFPPMPKEFLVAALAMRHHNDFMKTVPEDSIQWDDANRQRAAAKVRTEDIVSAVQAARVNGHAVARIPAEDVPDAEAEAAKAAETSAWVERTMLTRQRKAERRKADAAREALDREAREGMEDIVPTAQDRTAELLAQAGAEQRRGRGYQPGTEVRPPERVKQPESKSAVRERNTVEVPEDFIPPKPIDTSRWTALPKPLFWYVPGFIRPGAATLFSGRGGAGKGIVAMTLATAMMPGQAVKTGGFMGLSVVEGPVWGLFCEDEPETLQRRQFAIETYYGLRHGVFARNRCFHSLAGRPGKALAIADRKTGILEKTPLWRWVLAEVERFPRILTVLDPLSRLMIGDMNDPMHAVQFSDMMEELAAVSRGAVLLNFHPSTSALKNLDVSSGVGHSPQWTNAFRVTAFLSVPDPTGDTEARAFQITKSNDAPMKGIPLRWQGVRLDPAADAIGGLFAPDTSGKPLTIDLREDFLELFDRAWSRGIWVSDKPKAGNWAAKKLLEVGGKDAGNKALLSAMSAALGRLLGDGTLVLVWYKAEDRHSYQRLERAGGSAGGGAGGAGS